MRPPLHRIIGGQQDKTCSFLVDESHRRCPHYAAERGMTEEEALKHDMEAKSKEFVEKGPEVYAKALLI